MLLLFPSKQIRLVPALSSTLFPRLVLARINPELSFSYLVHPQNLDEPSYGFLGLVQGRDDTDDNLAHGPYQ